MRDGKRLPQTAPKVPLDVAIDIAEDLPDGAYFALIEELSGCDAADVAAHFDDEEQD